MFLSLLAFALAARVEYLGMPHHEPHRDTTTAPPCTRAADVGLSSQFQAFGSRLSASACLYNTEQHIFGVKDY